jgi:hypothetical protein
MLGQMELSKPLTGFALGRVAAPDITPAGLASRGWTARRCARISAGHRRSCVGLQ